MVVEVGSAEFYVNLKARPTWSLRCDNYHKISMRKKKDSDLLLSIVN